ncbi:unnamed protein product [Polarella glacialis]|uniref:BTB domain-containing protein n=1 Tax=Polarella glacialis TaxID=89957 RepID=A0A813LPK8_POLGL|nr:unnamed protein product [Polarella glacialis]CAE8736332.1 unnamed protein product [Polarella glacialis]
MNTFVYPTLPLWVEFFFSLYIYSKGRGAAEDEQVSLFLGIQTSKPLLVYWKIAVVAAQEHLPSEAFEIGKGGSATPREFNEIVTGSLFCPSKLLEEKGFLSDGTLYLRIQAKFVHKNRLDSPNAPDLEIRDTPRHVAQLCSDLGAALARKDGDVVLVAEGRELYAHRVVLRARSSVFRAMLDTSMTESSSGRIEIVDVAYATLSWLLDFIYTASLPEEAGTPEQVEPWVQLAKAADKYDVAGLANLCVEELKRRMSTSNVLRLLIAAESFRIASLKNACLQFATHCEKRMRSLHDQREFDDLGADLVRELFIFAYGTGKRRTTNEKEKEFDGKTTWSDLSKAQLQRACDERGLPTLGDREELTARLPAQSAVSESFWEV